MTPKRLQKKNKKARKIGTAQKIVLRANRLADSLKQFVSTLQFEKNGSTFDCDCRRFTDVDSDTVEWILNLEERNMKSLYEKCDWGWDFNKKKKEMTSKKSLYLVVKSSCGSYVGFSHFQFDMDYGCAVLYCYEIQLEKSVQGLGLGKFLMNVLERIAFANKMEKLVLTVFKHNYSAFNFFTSLGYYTDSTSPQDDEENSYCYVILSKPHTDYVNQML